VLSGALVWFPMLTSKMSKRTYLSVNRKTS
jgi:hypothetical protein